MYGMTNYGRIFAEYLIHFLIDEAGLKHLQCQMSIYYKYVPDGSKLVVLYYFYYCVYCYIYEELGKWFWDTLGNIFHLNLLGYACLFMSISVFQLKENYISVEQARYAIYIVEKYLYTVTVK